MEFWEKQKNLHLKQLDTYLFYFYLLVIVEIRLPMGYSPRWKKKIKKINIQNSKIDQANINAWIVKNFFG